MIIVEIVEFLKLWNFWKINEIFIMEDLHNNILYSDADFIGHVYYQSDSYIQYLPCPAGYLKCAQNISFSTISRKFHNFTVWRHLTMSVRLKQENHSWVYLWIASDSFFQMCQIWLCFHNCVSSIRQIW